MPDPLLVYRGPGGVGAGSGARKILSRARGGRRVAFIPRGDDCVL